MALQPATRRLLTEAAAATAYQPKGTYQPAGSYLTTAQLGAANGVASLGADGKVPAGQLPPSSLVSFAAAKAADLTRTSVGNGTADPDLAFASVPAGTYEVTYHCAYKSTATSQTLGQSLVVSAGVLTAALTSAGSPLGSTVNGLFLSGAGGTTMVLSQIGTGGTANTLGVVTYRGTLNLSAAATFSLSLVPGRRDDHHAGRRVGAAAGEDRMTGYPHDLAGDPAPPPAPVDARVLGMARKAHGKHLAAVARCSPRPAGRPTRGRPARCWCSATRSTPPIRTGAPRRTG
jgi:hypothetical protein